MPKIWVKQSSRLGSLAVIGSQYRRRTLLNLKLYVVLTKYILFGHRRYCGDHNDYDPPTEDRHRNNNFRNFVNIFVLYTVTVTRHSPTKYNKFTLSSVSFWVPVNFYTHIHIVYLHMFFFSAGEDKPSNFKSYKRIKQYQLNKNYNGNKICFQTRLVLPEYHHRNPGPNYIITFASNTGFKGKSTLLYVYLQVCFGLLKGAYSGVIINNLECQLHTIVFSDQQLKNDKLSLQVLARIILL